MAGGVALLAPPAAVLAIRAHKCPLGVDALEARHLAEELVLDPKDRPLGAPQDLNAGQAHAPVGWALAR